MSFLRIAVFSLEWKNGTSMQHCMISARQHSTISCCPSRAVHLSVFLCSVVHLHLPPRSVWHNRPLLAVVHAHTISAWPPVPYLWYMLFQGCDGCHHSGFIGFLRSPWKSLNLGRDRKRNDSFLFLSLKVRPRIHRNILISVLSKRHPLIYAGKVSSRNSNGFLPNEGVKQGRDGKKKPFLALNTTVSQTVWDTSKVTIND